MFDEIAILISEVLGTDQETSAEIFLVFATVVIGLFITVFITTYFFKSSRRTVYITGVSDAGKSQLFARLLNKDRCDPVTVTSQVPNIFDCYETKKNRPLRLIDIPGADKVRSTFLAGSLAKYPSSGLIYVIDSSQVVKDCRGIAECLYSILVDFPGHFGKRRFPLLVACNKQDLPGAKSCKVVKSILEKEFSLLNKTRAAALDQTSGGSGKKLLVTGSSTEFAFDCAVQKIQFVECVARSESDTAVDVSGVEDWLKDIV